MKFPSRFVRLTPRSIRDKLTRINRALLRNDLKKAYEMIIRKEPIADREHMRPTAALNGGPLPQKLMVGVEHVMLSIVAALW